LGILDPKEIQDRLVLIPMSLAPKEIQDRQGLKDPHQMSQAHRACKELRARREMQVRQGLRVALVQPERQAQPESWEPRARQAQQAH
jgi:hypothetical protein